jgi:hypothetical protein
MEQQMAEDYTHLFEKLRPELVKVVDDEVITFGQRVRQVWDHARSSGHQKLDSTELDDAVVAVRNQLTDRVIKRILDEGRPKEREAHRVALDNLAIVLSRMIRVLLPTIHLTKPSIRTEPMRLALGGLFGCLAAWFLLSPHWYINAGTADDSRVLANLLRPIVAATGAFAGVFAIAAPLPFGGLSGFRHSKLSLLLGVLERRVLLIIGVACAIILLLLAIFTVVAPKDPNVLLGIAALGALAATRFTGIHGGRSEYNVEMRRLTDVVRARLIADADVLLSFAAAMPSEGLDHAALKRESDRLKRHLDQITVIIATGSDPVHDVAALRRHLGLQQQQPSFAPFIWTEAHEPRFKKHGFVMVGQQVRVLEPPVETRDDESGETRVVQKGTVQRV